jgi:hypothetical protein
MCIPIPLAPVADIWRLVFITAVNDKRLEGFAPACAKNTFPARYLTIAKALRADIFAIAISGFYAGMFWFVVAFFFVAASFDLFCYCRRIFTYDFSYVRKPKAL